MTGKVVVITGGTSGIGQVAAEKLAAMGRRIVQVARDPMRGQAALDRLRRIAPHNSHSIHYADLSLVSETKRVGREIAEAQSQVDVLVNNVGAIFSRRELTEEGTERTFALNHMSYFVLTNALLERLRSSAPARIINTASDAHESGVLTFDDLRGDASARRNWPEMLRYGGPGYKLYARSKLCNILFTRGLANRLHGTGVTANCFHTGFVATRFADTTGGLMSMESAKLAGILNTGD